MMMKENEQKEKVKQILPYDAYNNSAPKDIPWIGAITTTYNRSENRNGWRILIEYK